MRRIVGNVLGLSAAIAVFAAVTVIAGAVISCSLSGGRRQHPWSASSLGIPRLDEPWKLMIRARGVPIELQLPRDLPVLEGYPAPVRAAIEARIQLRERNIAILDHLARELERLLKEETFASVPQPDRTMRNLVLGIDQADVVQGNPLYKHEDVLQNLPSYTHVQLFVPAEYAPAARKRLKERNVRCTVTINPVDIWTKDWEDMSITHACSAWMQDMFRVALDAKGKEYLFTPASYEQALDLGEPDIDYLLDLIDERENRTIVRLPIFFHSGNILLGVNRQRTLFVGRRALDLNAKLFFTAVQALPNEQSMLDLLQAITGADEVRVLKNSDNLFHMDMAMIMLDHGVVGLIDPLDAANVASDDRAMLDELRSVLVGLGYRIVPIPTVTGRMATYRSPVNIVSFKDRVTGQRTAFVPEFPDEQVVVQGKSRSLNRMIYEAYAAEGVKVIPVADRFSAKRGDIHCVMKVID